MILLLKRAKKELKNKHEFEMVQGKKFYSMKEKTKAMPRPAHEERGWQPK